MSLTFANLQTMVYQHCGLDSADTNNQTNVTQWLNFVQQDLCARWPWPFMYGNETVTTVADYTTGTVSINSGSPTVTGSSTVFSSAIGTTLQYFIQFAGFNDWYQVSAYNSGTSLTLSTNYQQSTNLTNATYTLRKFFYSLSSAADRIIDIVNWNTPLKLVQVDARTLDYLQPNPQSTNSSYAYAMWGLDTSGNLQFSPYPFPSDDRLLFVRETTRPVDGTLIFPEKYGHLIGWGAISIGYAYLRKFKEAAYWQQMFDKRLQQMKGEFRLSEDLQLIMRPIDAIQRSNNWISFPSNYPAIAGN
jgi:hypothetical protein